MGSGRSAGCHDDLLASRVEAIVPHGAEHPPGADLDEGAVPAAASQRIPSKKRTGRRTWRTQYSAEPSVAASSGRPVTFDTTVSPARRG